MIEDILICILIDGLVLGGTYALLALGFTLINGVARVFNLAHGSLFVLCAYYIYFLSFLGFGVSIVLSLILTVITGVLIYQFFIHPLKKKNFPAALVTLSLAMLFEALLTLIKKPSVVYFDDLIPGSTTILGVPVKNQELLILTAAIILTVILGLFINRTRVGKSIKAVAQNMDVARLVGINVRNTFMISMGISALLAGFAAVLYVPICSGVSPTTWTMLFSVFPVLVLGGLGSLKGAFVGAYIITFTETITIFAIQFDCLPVPRAFASHLPATVTFVVMLIIIFFKPNGIFGKKISL